MGGDPKDRRAAERLEVNRDVSCAFVSPVAEDFGTARVRDVSMNGIGLIVVKKVEAGNLLAVTLANPKKNFTKTLLVRVMHVTPVPGGFLAGGTFSVPLTYQEFTSLVM